MLTLTFSVNIVECRCRVLKLGQKKIFDSKYLSCSGSIFNEHSCQT